MRIKSLSIENYRRLNNVDISFDKNSNYLVGKNNIGKTSTLKLIEILLTGKSFQTDDFNDVSKSICVNMTFELSDIEIGTFGDNFSPENANEISIQFVQNDPDDFVHAIHRETETPINVSLLKKANYVSYSSNIRPIRENDLTLKHGDYKLIPQIVDIFINKHEPISISKTDYDKQLISFANDSINKIKPFRDNNIMIDFATDYVDFVARAITLQDSSGTRFSDLGFGLQFSSLIPLKIIDKIIQWNRYKKINDHLITTDDGLNHLSIILTIDEPEVHLHPNLQLQLMEYTRKVLNGMDSEFNTLLKQLFDIDSIEGQLFVVTHSPNILSNNYKEISRFTEKNGNVIVASGHELSFNEQEKKQLHRQLPYISMSLFADSVLIIEGDTELGAFPTFAKSIGINLVDYNVNIINANGFKNIPPLVKLFDALKINTVAIIDNDGDGDRNWSINNLFVTEKKDFEFECYQVMELSEMNHYLYDFEEEISGNEYSGSFWFNVLEQEEKEKIINSSDKISAVDELIKTFSLERTSQVKEDLKKEFLKKLKKKSILNGELIAQNISVVPQVYVDAIKAAAHV